MIRTLLAWLVLAGLGAASSAEIELRQVVLGLPAEGPGGAVYRSGAFSPVSVEIMLTSGPPRNIRIQIEQSDLDGDIVLHEKFTALTPDTSGPDRVHWLYFVPNPDTNPGSEGFKIQVLDDASGEPLEVTYNREPTRKVQIKDLPDLLADDSFLLLSVGESTAGYTKRLSDYGEDEPRFAQRIRVAHISPDGIPDHWHGLEMVDALVWDDADPSKLSQRQVGAVLEWVRQGGRLVIAASRTADLLAASPLADLLPVRLDGGFNPQTEIPEALVRLAWDRQDRAAEGRDRPDIQFGPVHVAQCALRPGVPTAIRSLGRTQTYAARWDVGRGRVVFVAVRLQDLFDHAAADPVDFFRRALWLRRHDSSSSDARMVGLHEPIELVDHLRAAIDFQTRATLYLFIIISFVFLYGLLATLGTWFVLQRRGALKYSWPAFGVVAAAASLVSLAAVRVNAGLGQKLDQLTIVDSTVDTYAASGRCYFGLKTSTMEELDLWLPSGWEQAEEPQPTPGFLRAMCPRLAAFGRQRDLRFADTQRYRSRSGHAAVDGVPIRATLKQLDGSWQGNLRGQLHAHVALRAASPHPGQSRIREGGTITNQLGYDLENCFLFETMLDPDHGSSRNTAILVHYIPRIADGEQFVLDQILLDEAVAADPARRTLQKLHEVGVRFLGSRVPGIGIARPSFDGHELMLSATQWAVLLLSSYAEYAASVDEGNVIAGVDPDLLQTNGRNLDRAQDIREEQLLLVAFSREDGPVQLRSRRGPGEYRALPVRQSTTAYRFTIPASRG